MSQYGYHFLIDCSGKGNTTIVAGFPYISGYMYVSTHFNKEYFFAIHIFGHTAISLLYFGQPQFQDVLWNTPRFVLGPLSYLSELRSL